MQGWVCVFAVGGSLLDALALQAVTSVLIEVLPVLAAALFLARQQVLDASVHGDRPCNLQPQDDQKTIFALFFFSRLL